MTTCSGIQDLEQGKGSKLQRVSQQSFAPNNTQMKRVMADSQCEPWDLRDTERLSNKWVKPEAF